MNSIKYICSLVTVLMVVAGCKTTLPDTQRVAPYHPQCSVVVRPVTRGSADVTMQRQAATPGVKLPSVDVPPMRSRTTTVATVRPTPPSVDNSNMVAKRESGGSRKVTVRDVGATHGTLRSLKSGDRVTITLRGIPKAFEGEDVIDGWGEVTLPFIGEVKIAGLTLSEAERKIERLYIDGGIYRHVNAVVVAEDEVYFVQGEVQKQGKFRLSGKVTLMQAISEAGGFTPFAKRSAVKVIRGDKITMYDYSDILRGKAEDPQIMADDIIEVLRRRFL